MAVTAAAGALTLVLALGYAASPARPVADESRRADAARFMNDLMSGRVPIGGPFTLTGASGAKVNLADFRGRVVVLYFGYTFCPDVCPTDLMAIAGMLEALGRDSDKVQPIFVTLDPERDKPADLLSYVRSFNPRIVSLTGTEREIREVATKYKVFYEKVQPPGSKHYVIDHMAYTYVIDRHGNYVGFLPPGTESTRMAAVVRELVAAN